jgi:transmembrane sensor
MSQKNPSGAEYGGSRDEVAAWWLVHLHSGDATDQDRTRFREWLRASDANAIAYRELQQIWHDIGIADPEQLEGGLRARRNRRERPGAPLTPQFPVAVNRVDSVPGAEGSPSRFRLRRGWGSYVTAIAASVAVVFGLWEMRPSIQRISEETAHYQTVVGQLRTVRLSDGSKITLGADSEIRVAMSGRSREVFLDKGVAFFDVTHDPGRPFIIDGAITKVRVVGTRFDVSRTASKLKVMVEKGVVQVGDLDSHDRLARGVTLNAGQWVEKPLDGAFRSVRNLEPSQVGQWRNGILIFRNAPLGEVVEELNRYRSQKIVLASASLSSTPITMVIPAERTDDLIHGLEATGAVSIRKTANEVSLFPVGA